MVSVANAEVETYFASGEGCAKAEPFEGQTLEQRKSAAMATKVREGAKKHKESLVMKFGKRYGTKTNIAARITALNTNDSLAPSVAA